MSNYRKIKTSLRNRNYLFFGTILIIMVVIFFVFGSYLSDYFNLTLSIIYRPYNYLTSGIVRTFDQISNLNFLYNENTLLKEKNVDLLQKNANLEHLLNENTELKKLLEYKGKNPTINYVTAKVYAQDPLNLSNIISIDQGTTNNVNIGQHVVYNGIYLGQIISADRYTAKVKLITDPSLSIIGQIPSINTNGIVHGQIGFGLIMEDIPPDAKLEIGQIVTTSAIDANMPENLILGEIIEIIKTDQNIFQKAIIRPFYQPIDIKYVLVYTNDQS